MNRPFLAPDKRKRHGPEYYWAQAKKFGPSGFTIAELHERTKNVTYTTIKLYVHALRDVGAIEKIGTSRSRGNGAHQAIRYAAVKSLNSAPLAHRRPRYTSWHGRKQLQLWTAMRAMPQFLVRELAAVASTDDVPISFETAGAYVSKLLRAGLIQVVSPPLRSRKGFVGAAPGIYRLRPSSNTGPGAPKVFGIRVFDPNRREFVGLPLDAGRQEDDVSTGEVSA